MDVKTAEIRYGQWVQTIRDWSNSGQNKRTYCRERGIDEKQFYYYQRRIRGLIAAQREPQALPEGETASQQTAVRPTTDRKNNHPQIVKLQFSNMPRGELSVVSFQVNGMNFTVPEDIPAAFLSKLLEAACHGSR